MTREQGNQRENNNGVNLAVPNHPNRTFIPLGRGGHNVVFDRLRELTRQLNIELTNNETRQNDRQRQL